MLNEKKVVPKLRQEVKVKVDIVTSDDTKIYYIGKFQDFTARYMIKINKRVLIKCNISDMGKSQADIQRQYRARKNAEEGEAYLRRERNRVKLWPNTCKVEEGTKGTKKESQCLGKTTQATKESQPRLFRCRQ